MLTARWELPHSANVIPLLFPGPPRCGAAVFQDRGRWLVPTLAVVLALGLAAFMGAKPAWRYVRTQRAMGTLAKAEVLAGEKKWTEVAPLLRSSLALAPGNLRGIRLAARYYTAIHSTQALQFMALVVGSGTATYEERKEYAALAVEMVRPDIARPMLDQLVKEKPGDEALYRLSIKLGRRLRMPGLQEEAAERWLRLAPENTEAQYELGLLRWKSTNINQQSVGKRLLWGIAFDSNRFTTPAVAVLAGNTNLTRTEADLLWRRLDVLALTNRFEDAELRFRLRPAERAQVVERLVGAVKSDTSDQEVAATVRWLADHHAVEQILPLLTPERIGRAPILGLAHIQALIEIGRMDEIKTALEAMPTNTPAHLAHCLRASEAFVEGHPDKVVLHLEQAAAAAGNKPADHILIARFAETFKQPRIALARWRFVADKTGGGLESAFQIVRLARLADDLPAAQPALTALRSQMATDASAALAAGYVEGLVGKFHRELLPQLREIVATNSPMPFASAVLGLAEWKTGDATAALRSMESSEVDWSSAEPRFQAIYAAVLGAAGQREAARLVAHRVKADGLAREERALIEPWL